MIFPITGYDILLYTVAQYVIVHITAKVVLGKNYILLIQLHISSLHEDLWV